MPDQKPNGPVLITGGNGNLGTLLAKHFIDDGMDVISFDLPGTEPSENLAAFVPGDMRDTDLLSDVIETHKPGAIVHLASLLSGSSAANPAAAWEINATASFNLMQTAAKKVDGPFVFASTIASYGSDVPSHLGEDVPQWPTNIYGATKVAVERAGVTMKATHGLDFRCLRFPMVLSPFAPPGAVTAYPSRAFIAAAAKEKFTFPVAPDTGMSTLFLEDVSRSLFEMTLAQQERLTKPAYNLHGFHFTASELADTIRSKCPDFQCDYAPEAVIDDLVASWPNTLDSRAAESDWDWTPNYDFEQCCNAMFKLVGLAD